MKQEIFVEQMARLMLHFESKLTRLQLDAYWEEMKYIPSKAFINGVTKTIRTREYPGVPTVGALLKASVGDHGHVVSRRLPYGRDAQLDDIVAAYKDHWEIAAERRAALPAPGNNGHLPAVVDKDQVIAELRLEASRLATDNSRLVGRVASLEGLLGESTKALADYRKEIRRQGEELARLERINREK